MAAKVGVFISSNRFKSDVPAYAAMDVIELGRYVNDTPTILAGAEKLLHRLFRKGVAYKKAGVVLSGIQSVNETNGDLLGFETKRADKLSEVVDLINNKFGKDTISFSAVKRNSDHWKMRRDMKSPSYTTRFSDVLAVKA